MTFYGQINLEKGRTLVFIFCVSLMCFVVSQNYSISTNGRNVESAKEDNSADIVIKEKETEEHFQNRMEKTFEERRERMRDICAKYGKGGDTKTRDTIRDKEHIVLKTLERFLWDSGAGTVYCPIAKVASTSWTANMLEMAGVNLGDIKNLSSQVPEMATVDKKMEGVDLEDEFDNNESWENEPGGRGIRQIARSIFLPPIHDKRDKDKNNKLISEFSVQDSLMIVRHPFHRLISAYEDKMLNPRPFPYKFHHNIQEAIKAGRKGVDSKIRLPGDLLLSIRYRQLLRNRVTTMEELRSQPSFREFVEYLIEERKEKKDRIDPKSWKGTLGWSPMYTVCPVCNLKFKFVIKLENMAEESEYFKQKHNYKVSESSHLHTAGGDANSKNKIKDYFSMLDKNHVDKLKNIYKYDLLLFDYNIDKFYEYAIRK